MVTFSRGSAQLYLIALAAWAAGHLSIIMTGFRGGASASVGPVAALLTCMFTAAATMLAIAVRMNQNDDEFGFTSAPTSHGWQGRWLVMLGLRWMFLLFGVAAPTAFRALDPDR